MILTLEATGPREAVVAPASRHVFSTAGGVIGRAKTSDWVLPNARVSGRHAVISFLEGGFYIEDTSTNGVFINSPTNRLVAGRRYALQAGDRVLIDPYEIAVSVSGGAETAPSAFDVEDAFGPAPALRQTPGVSPARQDATPQPVPVEEVDPLKLIGSEPRRPPARQPPTAEELNHRPVISDHYQPPAVIAPPAAPKPPEPFAIPADYDPLSDDFLEQPAPPPVPAPAAPVRPEPSVQPPPPIERPVAALLTSPSPVPPAPPVPPTPPVERVEIERVDAEKAPPREDAPPPRPPAPERGVMLADLLEGAGLENVQPTAELARSFGQIFRVVVSGVMDVLQSRQQVKDEFRMRITQFRPADNNPLKFSANVDDALHNLLVKRNPAYLGPVEAFEDAFEDLRNHQLAMLAGMRVAFESLLGEFDPDRLEKLFDRQLKGTPLLRAMARSRYWDLYRERREEMAKDPDASFKSLFGEEFARAFEEQLNRLKAESRVRTAAEKAGGIRSPGRG